jgi:DMSO/TMAO reductase YedYZ molybdopterin-dependent catalytic subunit
MPTTLRIDGLCAQPGSFTLAQLAQLDNQFQIPDVSSIDPKRKGSAVKLAGLLSLVGAKESARYLGLHAALDNFHASVPLSAVLERAFVIYQIDGGPLSEKAGGPFRFYIQDFASCHTDEVDECANVKFVDHIELTAEKGFDNRPEDEAEHAALHHPPQGE